MTTRENDLLLQFMEMVFPKDLLRYFELTGFREEAVSEKDRSAQRKILVVLHFPLHRHKASGAALGLSCAVCFEQPAGVFAGCGAVC